MRKLRPGAPALISASTCSVRSMYMQRRAGGNVATVVEDVHGGARDALVGGPAQHRVEVGDDGSARCRRSAARSCGGFRRGRARSPRATRATRTSPRWRSLGSPTRAPWSNTRPAPSALWPTSLLPMSSSDGSPTAGPWAASSVYNSPSVMRSSAGVSASVTALLGAGGATPTPSAITSSSGPGRPANDGMLAQLERHPFECTDALTPRVACDPRSGALLPWRAMTYGFDRYPPLRRAGGMAARRPPAAHPRPRRSSRPTARRTKVATCGSSPSPTPAPAPTTRSRPTGSTPASTPRSSRPRLPHAALIDRLVTGHADGDDLVTRGTAHPHLLRRAACQPRRRRMGARRPPEVPAVEHPPVAVDRRPPVARPARRGRRRRRPDPQHAHRRPERCVDAASRRRAADGAGATGRSAGGDPHLSTVGRKARSPTTTGSRFRSRPRSRVLDLNRNFPAGWGPKVPGAGDHPLSEPEIDALVRAIVGAAQHLRLQRVPHERWRVAAAVVDTARLDDRADSTSGSGSSSASVGTALTGYPPIRCSPTSRGIRATR